MRLIIVCELKKNLIGMAPTLKRPAAADNVSDASDSDTNTEAAAVAPVAEAAAVAPVAVPKGKAKAKAAATSAGERSKSVDIVGWLKYQSTQSKKATAEDKENAKKTLEMYQNLEVSEKKKFLAKWDLTKGTKNYNWTKDFQEGLTKNKELEKVEKSGKMNRTAYVEMRCALHAHVESPSTRRIHIFIAVRNISILESNRIEIMKLHGHALKDFVAADEKNGVKRFTAVCDELIAKNRAAFPWIIQGQIVSPEEHGDEESQADDLFGSLFYYNYVGGSSCCVFIKRPLPLFIWRDAESHL